MAKITVLIAEDHIMVREGLCSLLKLHPEFEVIAEACSGREALANFLSLRPQVVLMDLAMPGLNGIEAIRQIIAAAPRARILVLSAHSEEEYILHAASLGALGYLRKVDSGTAFIKALRLVAQGKRFFSAAILAKLEALHRRQRDGTRLTSSALPTLTPREAEVLQRVAEGAPNKQVADELAISIKTVEKHRQSLMDKLNIHHTAGLTHYAIASGMIACEIHTEVMK